MKKQNKKKQNFESQKRYHLKMVNSIIRTLRLNKLKITDIAIGWKNKNKKEPKLISINRHSPYTTLEKIKYLRIELYLKYPLEE